MAWTWTYWSYLGINFGLGFGLALVTFVIVFLILRFTKVKLLLFEVVLGLDVDALEDLTTEPTSSTATISTHGSNDGEKTKEETRVYNVRLMKNDKRMKRLKIMFMIICSLILSLMPVLIFNGCMLASTGLEFNEPCPEDPMECFVFNKRTDLSPVTSFNCSPGITFSSWKNYQNGYAWCFGWIVDRQTTKKVLDQLGVCAGLIGLFATILAIIVFISKGGAWVGLLIILLALALVYAIGLFAYFKVSVSSLTVCIMALSILSLIWGALLSCQLGHFNRFCCWNIRCSKVTRVRPTVVDPMPSTTGVADVVS